MGEKIKSLTPEQIAEKAKEVLTLLKGLTVSDTQQVLGTVQSEIRQIQADAIIA